MYYYYNPKAPRMRYYIIAMACVCTVSKTPAMSGGRRCSSQYLLGQLDSAIFMLTKNANTEKNRTQKSIQQIPKDLTRFTLSLTSAICACYITGVINSVIPQRILVQCRPPLRNCGNALQHLVTVIGSAGSCWYGMQLLNHYIDEQCVIRNNHIYTHIPTTYTLFQELQRIQSQHKQHPYYTGPPMYRSKLLFTSSNLAKSSSHH